MTKTDIKFVVKLGKNYVKNYKFMSNIFSSSIGKKLVMSLSGFFLVIFMLVHLTANAFIFVGADAFNAACHFMSLLTPIVPVLAAGFVFHITYAFILTLKNNNARPVKYKQHVQGKCSTWESRNMFVLGIIVFGVLILHLTDFWAKMQLLEIMGEELPVQPYDLVVEKFTNPLFSVIYIVWIIALWFHLRHGFWSAFQSVGLTNQIWIKRWKCLAKLYALLIAVGFGAIPIFIMIKHGVSC